MKPKIKGMDQCFLISPSTVKTQSFTDFTGSKICSLYILLQL